MTKKEYNKRVMASAPKSSLAVDMVWAYAVGGLLCVLGQALGNWYQRMGLEKDLSSGATAVSLIFLSALLTAIGVYDTLAKRAGAGTLVPITGFANAVVSPAMEFKSEGLVTGVAAKMFVIAGPVIVYGMAASVVYGLIYALLI